MYANHGALMAHTRPLNRPWRLIEDDLHCGSENMAVDEALLRSFDPATSQPVLRLYGWEPPALSLGRFQKAAQVLDLGRCRNANVSIVRRITGGGAIYHADELTYSIVCSPEHIPPASSVKDSFRVLTGFLIRFYRNLGLDALYAVDKASDGTRLGERTAFCFAGRETFDILIGHDKIGGNAQRRQKGIIFQHGSIPLVNRAATGLSYMREQSPEHVKGVASLAEYGIRGDGDALRQDLASAFKKHFQVELHPDMLTNEEREMSALLLKQKYLMEQWNLEGIE